MGRFCFTSNDKGTLRMTNLTHTIYTRDLQHRVIQFVIADEAKFNMVRKFATN